MRLHALFPLLLVATSCNDQGVTKFNALPEVYITSHQSGDVVLEGVAVEFRGLVGDPDNTATELVTSWYLGSEQVCADAPPDSEGITACTMSLGLDDSNVRLGASDPFNKVAFDEIDLSVEPTNDPEAVITSPLVDVVYYADRLVTFEGSISDAEDAPDLLVVTWSADGEALPEISSLPDSNGKILGAGYLTAGEHLVALDVEDTTGKTGQAHVIISVKETNSPPSCSILAPESGLVVEEGTLVSFEARVDDIDIPEEQIAVSWSSDWDGDLGSSSPNSAGEVVFSTSALSANTHTVTMVASDEVGVTCSEFLVLTVGRAPAISITMPTEGEEFAMGDPIRFEAQASDDGPVSDLEVTWESSLVTGDLHAEQADAKGQAGFTTYDLPAGEQVVTATVTDPEGLRSTDAVTIRVQACTATWYPDLDGDGYGGVGPVVSCTAPVGYVGQAGDCDDADALIHPNATETCDGVDEDCDGLTDNGAAGAPTWYADLDFDGYGYGASTISSCTTPVGYVGSGTDCDDGVATVHPGADEYCNLTDDDCDGVIDENSAVDASIWYLDADGDAYGTPTFTVIACAARAGFVADSTDCDDGEAAVHPLADEYCDGIDNDCDGSVDEAGSIDINTWHRDSDGDGYGDPSLTDTSCYAAGGWVADGTDCDDTLSSINPGAPEICNLSDDDCDGTVDEGAQTAWHLDADSDGYGDVGSVTWACSMPSGHVGDAADCDDSSANVYPAATEIVADGVDQDCSGGDRCYQDADQDGYGSTSTALSADLDCSDAGEASAATDCNDTVATIHPNATEICNAVDDDCDGPVDENTFTAWYRDADADGFGNANVTMQACWAPAGYIGDNTDCDDTQASAHPRATEIVADGVDQDCSGGDSCYVDGDGDGYGAIGAITSMDLDCSDAGESAVSADCDDSLAVIHPGATEIVADGVDQDCSGGDRCYQDTDQDGYGTTTTVSSTDLDCSDAGEASLSTDCNDAVAAIYPNAVETCNTIDDDCDGSVDENVMTTYYRDADADGYGASSPTTRACSVPTGYVANHTDCNDASSSIHPGAAEVVADGVDQDCSGGDSCYLDGDGDGYGTTTTVSSADLDCSDAGEASLSTDCNDAVASIHPNATETCNTVDDDCDGSVDENVMTTYYRDVDADGSGAVSPTMQACSPPAGYVGNRTDCNDSAPSIHPGAVEVVADGIDQDCSGGDSCYRDVDLDGYGTTTVVVSTDLDCSDAGEASVSTDCNDSVATVHPNATETCNLVDDDCDGVADEGVTTVYYRDADADTYGNALVIVQACSRPSGYVTNNTDCDDTVATIHPNATEYCNAVDDDCDGSVDEASAADAITWYADTDGDGYGDLGVSMVACTCPTGYVRASTDCDDTDATIFPGMTVSVPSEQPTIQQGIEAICLWGTVEVDAGTYLENVDYIGKQIDLIGLDGSAATTIDGGFNGTEVVTIESVDDVILQGFTITNGLGLAAGGVLVSDVVGASLDDLVITGNTSAGSGGGISVGGSGVVISNCVISDNTCSAYGGGGAFGGGIRVESTIISGNHGAYGGGVYDGGGTEFVSTTISGNSAYYYGGGAWGYGGHYESSTIQDNSARRVGGIWGHGNLVLIDSVVDGNMSEGDALGVFCISTLSMSGSTITNNQDTSSYGSTAYGVDCEDGSISDSVISGNEGIGLHMDARDDVSVSNTTVSENTRAGIDISRDSSDPVTVTLDRVFVLDNGSTGLTVSADSIIMTESTILGNGGMSSLSGASTVTNVLVMANGGGGLALGPRNTTDAILVRNLTTAGNAGDGLSLSPNWVNQFQVVNTVSVDNSGYGIRDNSTTYNPVLSYNDVFHNASGAYTGVTDPTGTLGNIAVDPGFVAYSPDGDASLWDLHLAPGSPLLGTGSPSIFNSDGSRSDIGAFGGPDHDYAWYDDVDNDGMYDGWEMDLGLNPAVNDSTGDGDGDGLNNIGEFGAGTDPASADTDGDGRSDRTEVMAGTDPLDAASH